MDGTIYLIPTLTDLTPGWIAADDGVSYHYDNCDIVDQALSAGDRVHFIRDGGAAVSIRKLATNHKGVG